MLFYSLLLFFCLACTSDRPLASLTPWPSLSLSDLYRIPRLELCTLVSPFQRGFFFYSALPPSGQLRLTQLVSLLPRLSFFSTAQASELAALTQCPTFPVRKFLRHLGLNSPRGHWVKSGRGSLTTKPGRGAERQ